jgi:hypothetical protein
MPTKKDKSYQIRLQCEKCGKFIDADLYVKITERDRYGNPNTYMPAKIPKYLDIIFTQGMDRLSRYRDKDYMHIAKKMATLGTAGVQNPHIPADEPAIVCKTCQQIKKLKE